MDSDFGIQPVYTKYCSYSDPSFTLADAPVQMSNDFKMELMRKMLENHFIVSALVSKMSDISEEVKILSKATRKIARNETTQVPVAEAAELTTVIPVNDDEEMEQLETTLLDKTQKSLLVLKLAKIGGAKPNSVINAILDNVFSKRMQANYSVGGRSGKKCLISTRVYHIILEATRCSDKCRTMSDSEIRVALGTKLASSGQAVKVALAKQLQQGGAAVDGASVSDAEIAASSQQHIDN